MGHSGRLQRVLWTLLRAGVDSQLDLTLSCIAGCVGVQFTSSGPPGVALAQGGAPWEGALCAPSSALQRSLRVFS